MSTLQTIIVLYMVFGAIYGFFVIRTAPKHYHETAVVIGAIIVASVWPIFFSARVTTAILGRDGD